jgi:hypothetical protein
MNGIGPHQMLDFLTGIKHGEIITGGTEAEAQAARQKFLDAAQKGIRDQIEITLPLIYLVRPWSIALSVKRGLVKQSEEFASIGLPNKPDDYEQDDRSAKRYDKAVAEYRSKKASLEAFITSINVDGKDYYPGDIEYHIALKKSMAKLDWQKLGQQIMDGLKDGYKKKIKFAQLVATATQTLNFIAEADQVMARGVASRTPNSPEYKSLEAETRKQIQKAGNAQFQWLTNNTPAQFEDPESFLNNYNANTDFLIVTPKFKSSTQGGRDIPNELARPLVVLAIRSITEYGTLTVNEKFSVGAFAAAGHTGATTQDEPGAKVMPIGINLPMRQAAYLFATSQSNFKNKIALNPETFVANTKHIDFSINFNKSEVGNVKTLLSAMFSFAVTMPAAYNSRVLSHQETAVLAQQLDSALGMTYKELGDTFKNKFYSPEGMEMFTGLHFSPTINESTIMMLMNAISGGKTPKPPGPSTAQASSKGRKGGNKTSVKSAGSAQKFSLPAKPKQNSNFTSSGQEPMVAPIDLISLQQLMNSQLQDVISANMGSGTSRNILNYRTGRFASSARVEKLSASRQGMITAFYSYMKNPYATFSDGGKQSIPKSRDPKLLISKSIREIAQQLVSNKLRAVPL